MPRCVADSRHLPYVIITLSGDTRKDIGYAAMKRGLGAIIVTIDATKVGRWRCREGMAEVRDTVPGWDRIRLANPSFESEGGN
jgi:hypothetical protein